MRLRQRLYDVDDLWELGLRQEHREKDYELIDGAIIEMTKPGGRHGKLLIRLGRYLDIFVEGNRLGRVTTQTGYFLADDRHTMLEPDLAFITYDRAPEPFPDKWIPTMPDLAIEIQSTSNTISELRDKARIYLSRGATLVWILIPAAQSAEVWTLSADEGYVHKALEPSDSLTGGEVLPGFELGLSALFTRT